MGSCLFAVFGRALYLAQHFEKNLRGVAAALDFRAERVSSKIKFSDDSSLAEIYDKKLRRQLGPTISQGLPKHVPKELVDNFKKHMLPPLDNAKEARNRIAHEFLFGIEGMDCDGDSYRNLMDALREDVRILADADFSVCCIIQGFNKDPAPCNRVRYVDGVVKWVFMPTEEDKNGQEE